MAGSGVWDRITEQAMPSTGVTHLHLFRHGKPDTGAERRCYGHLDLPLRPRGVAQHAALARLAAAGTTLPRPDVVLASDLARCRLLGEALADAWQVPLIVDPRLREQHMGAWEGRSWAELTAEDVQGVRAFWTDYATTRPPGGESLEDVQARVAGAMADHWPRMVGGRWALSSHAGVLRVMLCGALGVGLGDALRFSPLPGSHSWLMLAQAGAVLQVMGERPLGDDAGVAAQARAPVAADRDRPPRLALSGSAGTGKSTLARALAAHFGVPYLPEGMCERIEGGLDVHALGHDGLKRLVVELWHEQRARQAAALASHGGFVADRSPIDYAAFWYSYHFAADDDQTRALFDELREAALGLDRVVVLPFGVLPLEADGVRSPSPVVQRRFQALLEGLLLRELPAGKVAWMPALRDLDRRRAWVDDLWTEAGVDRAASPPDPGAGAAPVGAGR